MYSYAGLIFLLKVDAKVTCATVSSTHLTV